LFLPEIFGRFIHLISITTVAGARAFASAFAGVITGAIATITIFADRF
jgi:hypothetical protein